MAGTYKRIAYSFVMADLLHYGHIKLLKTACDNADYHICGLISDKACHHWQGINVSNYEERLSVIKSLIYVDEVMMQESMDPTQNLRKIKKRYPDAELIVIHGDDWKTIPGREYIESIGGKIIQPSYYKKLSRDIIIKKIKHSSDYHPFKYEYFTRHFRIGNLIQLSSQTTSSLLSSKADTLKNFESILNSSTIEKLYVCNTEEFINHPEEIIDSIQNQFLGKKLIIRSSSLNEDCYNTSNAGSYTSIVNVNSENPEEIRTGIQKVIRSYQLKDTFKLQDQILIQTQTLNIKKSGVAFTRNLETNTPYYLINYDDETGHTDTVTSGERSKIIWFYRNCDISQYPQNGVSC